MPVSKLRAKNFRSIGDVELRFSPITLLVGPNASGKSNIVDALRFVSDAMRWDLERAISRRHGVGAISRWRGDESPLDFEIGVQVQSGGYIVDYNFRVEGSRDGRFRAVEEWGGAGTADSVVPFHIENGAAKAPEWLAELGVSFDASNLAIARMGERIFPDLLKEGHSRKAAEAMKTAIRKFVGVFKKTRCYRIFPDALRRPQKLGKPYPLDEGGTNVGAMFRDLFDKHPSDVKRFRETIRPLLPGVTDIRFQQAGSYLVTELEHSGLDANGSSAWFDLSQESDGVLRALAMLGTMNQRPRLPLIAIEEPEMALTPHSIEVIAEDFAEATYWSQVVLTTHSPTLIDQFPIENLRAVQMVDGITHAGKVSKYQSEVVRQRLFTAGELHATEGLRIFFD